MRASIGIKINDLGRPLSEIQGQWCRMESCAGTTNYPHPHPSPTVPASGVATGGSSGSLNWALELLGAPSQATKK